MLFMGIDASLGCPMQQYLLQASQEADKNIFFNKFCVRMDICESRGLLCFKNLLLSQKYQFLRDVGYVYTAIKHQQLAWVS